MGSAPIPAWREALPGYKLEGVTSQLATAVFKYGWHNLTVYYCRWCYVIVSGEVDLPVTVLVFPLICDSKMNLIVFVSLVRLPCYFTLHWLFSLYLPGVPTFELTSIVFNLRFLTRKFSMFHSLHCLCLNIVCDILTCLNLRLIMMTIYVPLLLSSIIYKGALHISIIRSSLVKY